MKHYWTKHETEQLRIYQTADIDLRNEIFEKTLLPALNKLTECLVNMHSNYITDTKTLWDDCLIHLTGYLDKINCDKNPFAYLTLTAKHFVHHANKSRHRYDHRDISLDATSNDTENYSLEKSIYDPYSDESPLTNLDNEQVKQLILDYWDEDKVMRVVRDYSSKNKLNNTKRRGLYNRIVYYLQQLGSKHFPAKLAIYKKVRNCNKKLSGVILNVLCEESLSLLDK